MITASNPTDDAANLLHLALISLIVEPALSSIYKLVSDRLEIAKPNFFQSFSSVGSSIFAFSIILPLYINLTKATTYFSCLEKPAPASPG